MTTTTTRTTARPRRALAVRASADMDPIPLAPRSGERGRERVSRLALGGRLLRGRRHRGDRRRPDPALA
jgi:hypothetical protein